MTDRVNVLTVVLTEDLRVDDVEVLSAAIRQLRGVLSVEPCVAEIEDYVAYERARRDLEAELFNVLQAPRVGVALPLSSRSRPNLNPR